MGKLPFLITVPHGGTLVPEEVSAAVRITDKDLFDDSDSFTDIIYEVSNDVETEIVFAIARAFIDVNRAEGELPPDWTDGVVKSETCYKRPIYQSGRQPGLALVECLLDKYYRPFHASVSAAQANPSIKIALDCHSMADIAPIGAPDSGKRPLFNLGDINGYACDPCITELLKQSIMDAFAVSEQDITMNQPFKGGYITRRYGNKTKPWIQVEMNRSLYLSEPWFDNTTLTVETERLQDLNRCFLKTLRGFHERAAEKL